MSELIQKQEQLRELKQLIETPGWKLLYEQWTVRILADQLQFVAPPSQVSAEERVYLGGKVAGLTEAANLLDTLTKGLQSEIEYLQHQEEQSHDDSARKPDADDSDDAVTSRSHTLDPGSPASS